MEEAQLGTQSQPSTYSPFSPETSEPVRKKRCLRFSSDLSAEDPSLVGDSGFGDLGSNSKSEEQDGDLGVGPFFGLGESDSLLIGSLTSPLFSLAPSPPNSPH